MGAKKEGVKGTVQKEYTVLCLVQGPSMTQGFREHQGGNPHVVNRLH